MLVMISFSILWIIFVSIELATLSVKIIKNNKRVFFIFCYLNAILSGENVVRGTMVIEKNNSSTGLISASL